MTNNVVGSNQNLGRILAMPCTTDENAAHHITSSLKQDSANSGSNHSGSRRAYAKPQLYVLAISETEQISLVPDASETYTLSESRFKPV